MSGEQPEDMLYDLALRPYSFYQHRFGNDVYRAWGVHELRLARYLVSKSVLDSYVGSWHLVESREDLGLIVGYDLNYSYWFVQNSGEINIYPGAASRKPVRVVTNANNV